MQIQDLIKVKLTTNQLKALTGLAEDIGMVLFQNSTILKKINQQDFDVADEFLRWTNCNGRRSDSMFESRQREVVLFTK
jgi:lysozyme